MKKFLDGSPMLISVNALQADHNNDTLNNFEIVNAGYTER